MISVSSDLLITGNGWSVVAMLSLGEEMAYSHVRLAPSLLFYQI